MWYTYALCLLETDIMSQRNNIGFLTAYSIIKKLIEEEAMNNKQATELIQKIIDNIEISEKKKAALDLVLEC